MNAHVSVTLLETAVLANEVKIITTDNDGSLHFHLTDDTGEDTAADGAHASERAFLVDVVSGDCLKLQVESSCY